jgi:hypothetical protein
MPTNYANTEKREQEKRIAAVTGIQHDWDRHINLVNDGHALDCFCVKEPLVYLIEVTRAVADRQKIERSIVTRVIRDFLAAGHTLGVYDGEEVTIHHSADFDAVYAAMFTTDEDYLFIYNAHLKSRIGWVRFVYGNDGPDVICDYSGLIANSVIQPIEEWIEATYE